MFRLPPPYLWTPPTPQRAKGYTPLTILKKKSKYKKASAAPVGAITLTLFSLLHLKPLSLATLDSSPKGERARSEALRFNRKLPRYAKGSPFEERLPPAGGRCRAATKGGIWQSRQALTERARTLAEYDDGRGNIPHTKNTPCTVRCRGCLNLQSVTYSCTYPDSSSGSRRW